MNPIYGNHLGIVINDQDPEHRSRLQVFIPYLSNTLYSGWNEDGITQDKDITFKTFEDGIFSTPVKEKLKNILPWAEAAVPSFGGATSAPLNTTIGKAFTSFVKGVAASGSAVGGALLAGSAAIANQSTDPLYISRDGNSSNINSGTQTITSPSGQQTRTITNNSDGSITVTGDFTRNNDGNSLNPTNDTYQNGTATGIPNDDPLIPGITATQNSGLKKGDIVNATYTLNNKSVTITSVVNDVGSNTWGTGELGTNTLARLSNELPGSASFNVSVDGGTINPNLQMKIIPTGHAVPINNLNASRAAFQQYLNDNKIDSATLDLYSQNTWGDPKLAGSISNNTSSKPVQRQFAPTTIPPSTNVKGFYSKPMVGAKVWVFFYGGDIQRPVYFATVIEGNGSVVAYQPITS
jgi:hypothetical protein